MKILALKNKFYHEIRNLYPKTEIDSFFYLLSEHILNLKRVDIALNYHTEIKEEKIAEFNSALAKLKQEIPIQYIVEKTEFYGLPFYVNENVLIPRPETEELVHWALEDFEKTETITILDIGTGSGCIAISLAKNIKNAVVYALDISEKALLIAKKNAKLNNVPIQFLNCNILEINILNCKFDIIISNPPYIRELEKAEIKNNVLKHEPSIALFVENNNALIFYEAIARFAKKNLKQNGFLYFEINQYLGKETVALLQQKDFKNIELRNDIFKNNRMIRANLKKQL